MSDFTEGPWKWYPNELCQADSPYETILEKGCSGGYDSCGGYIHWGDNKEANANLIAAAPDLYEALDLVEDYLIEMTSPDEVLLNMVRKALEKAWGK